MATSWEMRSLTDMICQVGLSKVPSVNSYFELSRMSINLHKDAARGFGWGLHQASIIRTHSVHGLQHMICDPGGAM